MPATTAFAFLTYRELWSEIKSVDHSLQTILGPSLDVFEAATCARRPFQFNFIKQEVASEHAAHHSHVHTQAPSQLLFC